MNANGTHTEIREKALRALAGKLVSANEKGGMKAVGAELTKFVLTDITNTDIVPLLLATENPFVGTLTVNKPNAHKAYWLDKDGQYKASPAAGTTFVPTPFILKGFPEVNIFDLKRGQILGLAQQIEAMRNVIAGLKNVKTLAMFYAGAHASMTVDHTGALDLADLNAALTLAEDRGLHPLYWVGRATTLSAIKSDTTVGNGVMDSLQVKGVQNQMYGGASIVFTPSATLKKVILVCTEKAGAETPEFPLTQGEWKEVDERDAMQCKLMMSTRIYIQDNLKYVLVNQTD